ncbi:MAG: enoyl-CoA hydratase/isomerase family protein [Candidatus Rokubacteria bacterium]|nr:enoyl-CoA hydratase/isomerase family protein [Candidatus Rokubacteria bacterium]
MSSDRQVRTDIAGDVARITLARPPLNILTIAMIEELNAALDEVAGRPTLRALVLAAEGRAFSAGVAVEDHMGDRVKPMLTAFHQIFRRLHALDCPTVAAVQGPALGGGAELAIFCDLVIASETATVGQPEIKVGVFPPIAALCYPARVGPARALQLLCSGDVIPAREAERIGLVDRVVPPAELEAAVAAAVAGFADKSAVVLRLTKRALRAARPDDFEASLARLEALYVDELIETEDAGEGLRAFVEKRPPAWKHR